MCERIIPITDGLQHLSWLFYKIQQVFVIKLYKTYRQGPSRFTRLYTDATQTAVIHVCTTTLCSTTFEVDGVIVLHDDDVRGASSPEDGSVGRVRQLHREDLVVLRNLDPETTTALVARPRNIPYRL